MKKIILIFSLVFLTPFVWGEKINLNLRQNSMLATTNVVAMPVVRMASASVITKDQASDGVLNRYTLSAGATKTSPLQVGDELTVQLGDDVEIVLILTEKVASPLGGRSFLATDAKYDGAKNAVVHETTDGLQIDIQDYKNGRVYTVVSDANGVVVKEIDPNAGKVIPEPLRIPELPAQVHIASEIIAASTDGKKCLDILVAFDRNATRWANSNGGGITNFATVAVQKMNTVLANTDLSDQFRFRLVGAIAVDAETVDLDTALDASTKGTDNWSAIKTMRDTLGADLVSVLIDTGSAYGTVGLGWSLTTTSVSSFAGNAYSACAIRSVAQSYTMVHECGHNLGAGHSDRQSTQPGPQLYSYSSGYYFTSGSKSYHTIMAYNSDGYTSTSYQAVPYFSSPDYSYGSVAVGDATHDNTRTLLQTYAAAAAWRAQKVPDSYDVVFSPESETSFDTSLSVTLTPGLAGVDVRYTTDGTEPTASSPLYSSPITITETTTIKACTVVDGAAGPFFQATYYKQDLGVALNAPQYKWTTGADCPWEYETTNTYDGVHALGTAVPYGGNAWVKTTVVGPKYVTMRRFCNGNPVLTVLSDSETVYSESWSGYSISYYMFSFAIPAGTHELKINLYSRYGTTFGFIDDVVFYDAEPPSFNPPTSSSAIHEFEGSMFVTLTHPSPDAQMYYTLDGTDPTAETALLYEGPFPITKSVKIRAIANVPGSGSSPERTASYSERHTPKPGEWTTNIDGALSVSQNDGKLIAILAANYNGCYYSEVLDPIARGTAFLSWAAANGVYLVSADGGRDPDASAASSKFYSLYSKAELRTSLNGYTYYPTFVLTTPVAHTNCVGAFVARTGRADLNGIKYDGTSTSLVKIFASALGETPLGEPVVTMSSKSAYPRTITVQNTNGTGIVYYTLDGSAPTRTNGIRYTSPVTVASSGGKFMTAVWPSSGSGVSSPVVVEDFKAISDILGTSGLTWQNDASLPWTEYSSGWMQGGKDLTLTTGTKTSTLKATVSGKGKLVFDYGVASRSGTANLRFKTNGTSVETWYSGKEGSYVYEVTSTGTTTIEWTYTYPYYDSYSYLYAKIGNVKWINASTAPSDVSASDGEHTNGVFVSWNDVSGATSYRLYRCSTESFLNPVLVRETEKLFGWDATAEVDKTYWYAVSAVNAYGESVRSTPVSGWRSGPLAIKDDVLPTAFTTALYSHRLMASGGKAPFTWKAVSTADSYSEQRPATTFAQVGTAKSWQADDKAWELALPFAFPFYGKTYTKAYVNSNGTISFGETFSGYSESLTELKKHATIAVLWDDLKTSTGDIYVSTTSESVTIRWAGTSYSGGGAVNFSATLSSSGDICLKYGAGNASGGLIGVSAGDGSKYLLSAMSQKGSMANAADVLFAVEKFPDFLSLDTNGVLSGTPTAKGSSRFSVLVTDANGTSVSKRFVLTVADSYFTVTFDLGGHGTRTGGGELNQKICGGADAVAPTVEAELGWRFCGWNKKFTGVTGNLQVSAVYEEYSLARAVDNESLVFTTSGDALWTLDFDQSTVSESSTRSGLIGDSQYSAIETTVSGPGTLTFRWKTSSEIYKTTPIDYVAFSVDGGECDRIGGETEWVQVTISVTGTGKHTLRWTYYKDMSDSSGEDCAWLDGVTWTGGASSGGATVPADVTGDKEITIEENWVTGDLVKRFGSDRATLFTTKFGSDFLAALLKPTGKIAADGSAMCVWQDYVAGTDPTDPESKFTATITLEDGVAKVKWEPDLNEDGTKSVRTYKTLGTKNLGGAWTDMSTVPESEKSDYQFFKVTVEMP